LKEREEEADLTLRTLRKSAEVAEKSGKRQGARKRVVGKRNIGRKSRSVAPALKRKNGPPQKASPTRGKGGAT